MIKEYLNQPSTVPWNKWKLYIAISTFIALFLLIFQPIGLNDYNGPHKLPIILGYGLVTFIVLVINHIIVPLVFKKWFGSNNWTVLKQMGWTLFTVSVIGLGNFLYTVWVFSSFWGLYGFLIFQAYTLAVAIIPTVVITILGQNYRLAQNLKLANEFNRNLTHTHNNPNHTLVSLIADNEKDKLEVELQNLLYIESTGNYIEVYYTKDDKLKNTLLRCALKRAELQVQKHKSLVKCHRAFIVNTLKIEQVKGNSQGLRLALIGVETEIPVSRNFAKDLKERLGY